LTVGKDRLWPNAHATPVCRRISPQTITSGGRLKL
jgi:hypothetical protein